ncbi:MAG: sugar phosphate nucleotidyltransferase [Candidatus Gastranaerophilales bacterium]|nr:sugar phosphate nucleotidyltransferase [Candidatus Gastranaerophilales bacterium]MCM1073406.1 sugar phosphate nucleotidyltransferase [Bacteroides sp.]
MNIQKISAEPVNTTQPAFKSSFVTLSKKNLGEKIATNVVDTFNGKILPEIRTTQLQEANSVIEKTGVGSVIQKAKDFQEKINFFTLAAGSGSRFRELAQTVGDFNKISLPFRVGQEQDIHMLDFAMAMGKYFIDNDGVQTIVASTPSGSFGDIVGHYMAGNPIKDTVVCCGDNVFGDKATELMEFFAKTINNPNKHIALVGVGRTPEEVANRFGVLECEGDINDEALKLKGFSEKPPIEEAEKLAIGGQNIANTGLFYLSKEAMTHLIEEIKGGVNNIKKNDSEPYDFANAVKYVHSQLPEWFGIDSSEGADVKVVKKWEDVGEPQALYSFADEVKQGTFLANFPQRLADQIQNAFKERVHLDSKTPHIIFADSTSVTEDKIRNSKEVEGVHIVV